MSIDEPLMGYKADWKICSKCRKAYPPASFRKRGSPDNRSSICKPCIILAAQERRNNNRFRNKAVNTIRRHSQRLKIPRDVLENLYGWDIETIERRFIEEWSRNCKYCGKPYQKMEGGVGEISLDIDDPEVAPFFVNNVEICCKTCNSTKGRMTKQEWGGYLTAWKIAEKSDPISENEAQMFLGGLATEWDPK